MHSQLVVVKGHIIDSLILPKILDQIMDASCRFKIEKIQIGKRKSDTSFARVKIIAPTRTQLKTLVSRISEIGAMPIIPKQVNLKSAPKNGVFPDGFYCTTNLKTLVYYLGKWVPVKGIEMDCGIVVNGRTARCVPMASVKKGQKMICGKEGVQIIPLERSRKKETFHFMSSAISSEKPKSIIIRDLAKEMKAVRRRDEKILVVAGPAVVHTGASPHLARLIQMGYCQVLFGGNGLATHDMEYALYGTSLGINLDKGAPAQNGHDFHMRTINKIRGLGGIHQAVQKRILKKGVMYTCVKKGVDYCLAGSIRDDGPIPDVITDVVEAQQVMRRKLKGVTFALMIASTLHSIATGNMLPATVRTICVDINPAVVTKVADRGTFQILGLVTDSESFLRQLTRALR